MKKEFIIRFITFLIFSIGVPLAYMLTKFKTFQNGVKLGIVEILCISIVIGFGVILLKYYLEGMKTKYSLLKQIVQGLVKVVVPLGIALLVIIWLGDNIEIVKKFLYVALPSEAIAIVVNPLPKWAFNNNVDGLGEILGKVLNKKDEIISKNDSKKEIKDENN